MSFLTTSFLPININFFIFYSTGGLCFAQWSDGVDEPRWYRGHCIQYENDKPQILFIDYGNYEAVDIKNIRAAPEEFYFECITATIVLAGKAFGN